MEQKIQTSSLMGCWVVDSFLDPLCPNSSPRTQSIQGSFLNACPVEEPCVLWENVREQQKHRLLHSFVAVHALFTRSSFETGALFA